MLTHRGVERTFLHNLQLAVLLSFCGGLVNVLGVIELQMMTTNVTGYLSVFVEDLLALDWLKTRYVFLLIFSFFSGAFFSHFVLLLQRKLLQKVFYTLPLLVEVVCLILIGTQGDKWIGMGYSYEVACFLLFLMGLQNSLVTFISNAVVRTTHVTGIFTDLGIETARLLFYFTHAEERMRLFSLIGLKLAIVISFCCGGIVSGYFYDTLGLQTLCIASVVLLFTSGYDYFKTMMADVIEESKKHLGPLRHIRSKGLFKK
ncbi:YoaK family protein [Myroides pelagicus]|uniref:DUF1275 domain-containing protein n=1 Tax=Myroides pelagicus TaxID=270914 RepID=A0A7K1GLP0_9FLAO|nr:YoaK family protein [Myroides pelagicus]MEC4113910.1 YoaK family protein [Myroides pelagicus]MTH29144.1 DUF1275 domain-containing protein [Myroides pelagicus]